MPDSSHRPWNRPALALSGLALLAVYLTGMAPGIFWRDSMEFCFIGYRLDIGHPAGSPAFSLLAKALSFLPFGSLAWRANLLSIGGALTAVLLLGAAVVAWLENLRLATGVNARLLGAIAALGFAFSPAFWSWSEVAEVYSLQAAALAGLLWLAARAFAAPEDARWPAAIGLALGLSCGIHMVQILYAPAFALALLFGPRRRVDWRGLALMIGFFFIGFAVYAYLPVRSLTPLTYDYGNPESWDAFVGQITGRKYAGIIHQFPWIRIGFNLTQLAWHFVDQLNPVLTLGALAGLGVMAVRAPRLLLLVALVFLGHLYLYVKDWHRAFGYIPLFLLGAACAGLGWAWIVQTASMRSKAKVVNWTALLALAAVLTAGWGIGRNWRVSERRTHDLAQRHGQGILASLPTGAILVGYQDSLAYNLFYQQLVEKARPDVSFIHRAWLSFPDELARRFPDLNLTDYQPNRPGDVQRMLLASAGSAGVYWDNGWEAQAMIDTACLVPHGVMCRLMAEPWDGSRTAIDSELWRTTFLPILSSPWVAPRGADWTAQEIYSRIFHLRAKLHTDARRWESAEADAKTALHIRPDFAEYQAFLGLVFLAAKQYENALAAMEEALRLDPLCAPCFYYRGQLHSRLKDSQGALLDFEQALVLQPYYPEASLSLARAYLLNNRPEDALARLLPFRGQAQDSELLVENLLLSAAAYRKMNRCGEVTRELRQLNRLAPGHPAIARLRAACGFSAADQATDGK